MTGNQNVPLHSIMPFLSPQLLFSLQSSSLMLPHSSTPVSSPLMPFSSNMLQQVLQYQQFQSSHRYVADGPMDMHSGHSDIQPNHLRKVDWSEVLPYCPSNRFFFPPVSPYDNVAVSDPLSPTPASGSCDSSKC